MNKCDFCEYSIMKNGKLVCKHAVCLLSQDEIMKILKELAKLKR